MADNAEDQKSPDINRRSMLAKLGLALGAVYAAPLVLGLDAADAQGRRSRSDRRARGRGRSWSDRRRRRGPGRRSWSDRRRRPGPAVRRSDDRGLTIRVR